MTKDGDMRVERRPFPMTILISTQDVGAFQGGWDALLKQLFSDPLGLHGSSSPPHLLLQAPGSHSWESPARIPETTFHPCEETTGEADLSQVLSEARIPWAEQRQAALPCQ